MTEESTGGACSGRHRGVPCVPEAGEAANGVCTRAAWCRRVTAETEAEDPDGPVCLGRGPAADDDYFWLCRQCLIVYPGFRSEAAALRMARSHCVLRRREHLVGKAVRARRRAGLPADLSYEELREALRDT
ncbi:hypothetical protein ABZW32_24420 [Streptomyces sp. NPDC004667]|uniref:hypothetical protein n=1 Tax=Streptomyces sp. NPDC004667 TaxID=3154285 RepID=UPI0033B6BBD1